MLKKAFKTTHQQNRMGHEGNVVGARKHYFKTNRNNLKFLLHHRFEWMNKFIRPGDVGMEVGAGIGISKLFINSNSFIITDFSESDWLDVKNVDALATPFTNGQFDFVVSSNMIHHVPYPVKFFKEMHRILKPGGVLLIQEINASFFMRLILRLMRHEGYDFNINVFDENLVCTDPNDLWSANCAIPNLLFDDPANFKKSVSYFKIVKASYSEFFNFLNSGGVIAKTFFIPLPLFVLKIVKKIDDLLANAFPKIFALQRQIILKKNA